WQKNVLHLNGGKSVSEINSLKNTLASNESTIKSSFLGGAITALSKQNPAGNEFVDISSQLNNGVGIITYYGHGSATTLYLNFRYISDWPSYNNINKFPFLYFNGCGVGNIYSGRLDPNPSSGGNRVSFSTDWLLPENKGAIVVMANTFLSYLSISNRYVQLIYKYLLDVPEQLTIGQVQQRTAVELFQGTVNAYDVANLHQSLIQGDPAVKIARLNKPDYIVDE